MLKIVKKRIKTKIPAFAILDFSSLLIMGKMEVGYVKENVQTILMQYV